MHAAAAAGNDWAGDAANKTVKRVSRRPLAVRASICRGWTEIAALESLAVFETAEKTAALIVSLKRTKVGKSNGSLGPCTKAEECHGRPENASVSVRLGAALAIALRTERGTALLYPTAVLVARRAALEVSL